ncbi:MAG: hypothetical protein RML12_03920 [Xanthomonadales bacterium]|nr:hypothetical protein [Xanthomonadales bacterium]
MDALIGQAFQALFLGATQHDRRRRARAQPLVKFRETLFLGFRTAVGGREIPKRPKLPGPDAVDDGPQILNPVLHGGAGDGKSEVVLQGLRSVREENCGILDLLRLVEDGDAPADAPEAVLVVAQRLVGREHQVRPLQGSLVEGREAVCRLPPAARAAQLAKASPAGLSDPPETGLPQVPRVLVQPVPNEAGRGDDEEGAVATIRPFFPRRDFLEPGEKGEGDQRFPEAHVVREKRPRAPLGPVPLQPAQRLALMGQ